jgi:hypothetical protein
MDCRAWSDEDQYPLLAVKLRTAGLASDLKIWEHIPPPSQPADSGGGLGVELDAG